MFIRSQITRSLMVVGFLSVFVVTSILTSDYSYAQRDRRSGKSPRVSRQTNDSSVQRGTRTSRSRRDFRRGERHRSKRRVYSPRFTRHGHVVPRLPRGYRRAWHNKVPYFYNRGVFYRNSRSGFIVVRPPRGVVVVTLPIGYRRVWVDNSMYYTYGGDFYRRVPGGYTVVDPPARLVVEEAAPVVVKPPEAANGIVTVTASILNVRSGPSLRDPIIYQIHKGYILEIHGKTIGWLYVQLPNGEFGWVMNVYTSDPEPPGSG